MTIINNIVPLAIAYLVGSIPFAYLLSLVCLRVDVRTIGSGNIGATNALRTGSRGVALLTLLFDVAKAFGTVKFFSIYAPHLPHFIVGLGVVIGHIFPIWLKFKGGKGVASMFGVIGAASLSAAAFLAGIWVVVFGLKRYASLASLITALLLPLFVYMLCASEEIKYAIALAVLVVFAHGKNMQRLVQGTELKI